MCKKFCRAVLATANDVKTPEGMRQPLRQLHTYIEMCDVFVTFFMGEKRDGGGKLKIKSHESAIALMEPLFTVLKWFDEWRGRAGDKFITTETFDDMQ